MKTTIFTAIMLLYILCAANFADIPHYISYQGYLTDNGEPVTDILNTTFKIYDSETGGQLIWQETRQVEIENGYYSIILGETNILDIPFSTSYWLEIQIAGLQPMTPRYMITSSPYSYYSQYSDFAANIPDFLITTNKLANSAVTTDKMANEAVTNAKIADGSVDYSKITTFGIQHHNIAYNAVKTANIENGTISGFDIGQNGASLGQVLKWNGNSWFPENDEVGSAGGDDDWTINGDDIYHWVGKVGIGTPNPTEELQVNGDILLEKNNGRLILRTPVHNSTARAGLKFDNNDIGLFTGDDTEDQVFSFMSEFAGTRTYDARLRVHGSSTANWFKYIELTHNGDDGILTTDAGDIVLSSQTGRVGIGTSTPLDNLEVNGNSAFISVDGRDNLSGFKIRENGANRWILFFRQWQGDNLIVRDEVGGLDAMTFESGTGKVGIGVSSPEQSLHINGKLKMNGISGLAGGLTAKIYDNTIWYQSSSARNKSDIRMFEDDFEKILNLNPKSAIDNATGAREVGYIAEDLIEAGLENLVINNDKNQPEAVNYEKIPLYLIEIIKSQKVKIEELELRLAELESVSH